MRFLRLCYRRRPGDTRHLDDGCNLTLGQPRQVNDLAVGKLERVMVNVPVVEIDLAEAGDAATCLHVGNVRKARVVNDLLVKSEFGARQQTDGDSRIADGAEATGDG